MHFYACPFCDPCEAARLIEAKSEVKACIHKKDRQCEAEDYKCKEVMKCKKCKAEFAISKKFLAKQKKLDTRRDKELG